MKIEKDFEDLIILLNKNGVKYCIVGGFAVIFYTIPRYTGDMDILVESSLENVNKTIQALKEFGIPTHGISAKDMVWEGKIIEIGRPPVMLHIMTKIDGVKSGEVWENIVKAKYGKTKAFFIGLEELINNKKICSLKSKRMNKIQDAFDLKLLQKLKKKNKK